MMTDRSPGRALADDEARRLRERAQHLGPRPRVEAPDPGALVRDLVGVQAQEAPAAALALRARAAGLVAGDVERARVVERTIVRTWALRGTLHLLAAADLGWLLPLLGPVFARANRRRRLQLGLDDETTTRGVRLLRARLADEGPLTRAAIVERLAARGLPLEGQAAPHLIAQAAHEGVVCHGPERDGEPTYTLLADWAESGPAMPREAALAALARRYLAAYGPAGPEDLAHWSGLPLREIRAAWGAIRAEVEEVEVGGKPAALLKARAARAGARRPAAPRVRLLPGFDPYLLGYRDRALIVAPADARRIHPGGGVLHPTLLIDGRAAGTWRSARRREGLEIAVAPFATLDAAVVPPLEAEVADIGRFLGTTATLQLQT